MTTSGRGWGVGRLIAVMILGLALLPSAARASSDYVLTVIHISENPTKGEYDATARITEALAEHPQVRYRDLHQLLNVGGDDVNYGNIVSARQSFKNGLGAFELEDFEEATGFFGTTMQFLNASYGGLIGPALLMDTQLYLAACQWHMIQEGDDDYTADDVRETLKQLLVQSPDYYYPKGKFQPEFNLLVEQVRGNTKGLPTGSLLIDTDTGLPGIVYLNGTYRGVTPVRLFDLREGRHMVKVVSQGSTVGQSVANVTAGATAEITVELEPARKGDLLTQLLPGLRQDLNRAEDRSSAVRGLKGLTYTDYVVLVSVSGEEIHAGLFSLVSGTRIRTARAKFSSGVERPAKELVNRLLTVEELKSGPTVVTKHIGSKGLLSKWWFWAGTAAVVTGVVVTIVLLKDDGGEPGLPKTNTGALLVQF